MVLSFAAPVVFPGSRIKMKRANTHIADLEARIRDFQERKPFHVLVNEDADGMQSPCCEIREDIDPYWGAVIGDAAHNLRSALDLMINDLAAADQRGKARFPIVKDEDAWTRARKRMGQVSPSIEAEIKALQPYLGGDERLRDLHLLDIEDKHALLLPAAAIVVVKDFSGTQVGTGGTMSVGEMRITASKAGMHPLGVRVHRMLGFQFHNDFNLAAEIVFGDTDPLPGAPILPTLKGFAEAVAKVVDAFSPRPPTYITA
jgi:hypothetical protein